MTHSMIAVLNSSHECPEFTLVRRILGHWHIPYVVYGMGEPRHGNRDKTMAFLKAIHDVKAEYLLCIDAWDVICLRGPEELIAKFERVGAPWLFAAEPICWPDKTLAQRHPPCETRYRYLNGGCMMVRRDYASQWEKTVSRSTLYDGPYPKSDQYWWMMRYLENPTIFTLDAHCELFQCIHDSSPILQFSMWEALNTSTGTSPLVIHFNNHVKMDEFRGKLWWWEERETI